MSELNESLDISTMKLPKILLVKFLKNGKHFKHYLLNYFVYDMT